MIYKGKFFAGRTAEFYEYGIGAMHWVVLDSGNRGLWVIFPYKKQPSGPFKTGWEVALIYCNHADNNWAKPGVCGGWDGNLERPTFKPSIDNTCRGKFPDAWHGWIQGGDLKTA